MRVGLRKERDQQMSPPVTTPLSRLDVLRGLRFSVWDGAFATIWITLTSGAFITGFALWLHADSVSIGLLTAVPTLAALVQLLSSYTTEALPQRRPFIVWYSLAGRLLWLPILLLPFFLSGSLALTIFLVLFTASSILTSIPMPAWSSWMSDLVPVGYRGRYFGYRNMVAGITGMVISLPAAWLLDVAVQSAGWTKVGFALLFGTGVIGGIVSGIMVWLQPEPPRVRSQEANLSRLGGLRSYFAAPFADIKFRHLLLFNVVFGVGQNLAAPFFTVYALKVLQLNYLWMQVLAAIVGVSALVSMPFWGYLADKFGNKPLLAIGTWGVLTLPISWIFTVRGNNAVMAAWLLEINVGSGVFWAVVGLAQFNLLIGCSSPENTSVYVATMSAVTGLLAGIAPLVGGYLMHLMSGLHFMVHGIDIGNYQVLFLLTTLLRLVSIPLRSGVQDVGSQSASDVIKQLGQAKPRNWAHIRKLQKPAEHMQRLRAAEALAESPTALALGELVNALQDPSLEVREQAARALGNIGNRLALEPLLQATQDEAASITTEAAQALGVLGDRRAVPHLIALMSSTSRTLRRAELQSIIAALGALGGEEAAEALIKQLEGTSDPGLQEDIADSLGRTRSEKAVSVLTNLINRSRENRTICVCCVRALGRIGAPQARDILRSMLVSAGSDQVMAAAASTALARIGDTEAVPLFVTAICVAVATISRRQIAHSLGIILDHGEPSYRLISAADMDRDGIVVKMIKEAGKESTAARSAARHAIQSYTSGDFNGTISHLVQLSALQPKPEDGAFWRSVASLDAQVPLELVLVAVAVLADD